MSGIYYLNYISKTNFELLEKAWVKVLYTYLGGNRFVSRDKIYTYAETCDIQKFLNYTLLNKMMIYGYDYFRISRFEFERGGEMVNLAESKRNLRPSTLEKSMETQKRLQKGNVIGKDLLNMEEDIRKIFLRLSGGMPHVFKYNLKKELRIRPKCEN